MATREGVPVKGNVNGSNQSLSSQLSVRPCPKRAASLLLPPLVESRLSCALLGCPMLGSPHAWGSPGSSITPAPPVPGLQFILIVSILSWTLAGAGMAINTQGCAFGACTRRRQICQECPAYRRRGQVLSATGREANGARRQEHLPAGEPLPRLS